MLNISPVKAMAPTATGLKSCITEYKEDGPSEAQNSLQGVNHQRMHDEGKTGPSANSQEKLRYIMRF